MTPCCLGQYFKCPSNWKRKPSDVADMILNILMDFKINLVWDSFAKLTCSATCTSGRSMHRSCAGQNCVAYGTVGSKRRV